VSRDNKSQTGYAPYSIKWLLDEAVRLLRTESAQLDAEVLLAYTLGKPRSYLHAWPEQFPAQEQQEVFSQLIGRRIAGEPVAHLVGEREFWSLPLSVTTATLIPRPETETLVALALEKLAPDKTLRIADLGTGSGAIALAIARERPHCEIIATDISPPALAVARENARRLGADKVLFVVADWCHPLPEHYFDLIVSNPPYVADNDPHLNEGDVRFEPRLALAAGPAGMDQLQRLVRSAATLLRTGGWLLVEHGHDQGAQAAALFRAAAFVEVAGHKDLAGLDRVTLGRRPGK